MTMNGPFRRPQIVPGESGAHGCPKDRNKNDTDHLHRRLPTSCLVHIGAAAVTESRACFAKVPLRPNSIAMSKRKTAPFRSYFADLPGADREKKQRATAWRCDLKAGNDAGPSAGPIYRSILLPSCQSTTSLPEYMHPINRSDRHVSWSAAFDISARRMGPMQTASSTGPRSRL